MSLFFGRVDILPHLLTTVGVAHVAIFERSAQTQLAEAFVRCPTHSDLTNLPRFRGRLFQASRHGVPCKATLPDLNRVVLLLSKATFFNFEGEPNRGYEVLQQARS